MVGINAPFKVVLLGVVLRSVNWVVLRLDRGDELAAGVIAIGAHDIVEVGEGLGGVEGIGIEAAPVVEVHEVVVCHGLE